MSDESKRLAELIQKRDKARNLAKDLFRKGFDKDHPDINKAVKEALENDAAIRKIQNPKEEKADMDVIRENLKTLELKMQSMKIKTDLKKIKEKPKKKSFLSYFRTGEKGTSTHEAKA